MTSKGDLKNITVRRPRNPQASNPNQVDGRDTFQTPNYAVDLLIPYLDGVSKSYRGRFSVWECAAGLGKIVRRLMYHGYDVRATDLDGSTFPKLNFLNGHPKFFFDCIVTNTPFSLKRAFFRKCLEYQVPFALLIPADYSQWVIDAVRKGAEKIIPTRRIDYITPNTLVRIHEGEVWEKVKSNPHFEFFENLNQAKESSRWNEAMSDFADLHNYASIYDAPKNLLRKYSSSYFHSLWLTWGFKLGKTETFAELTNEMKDNI